MEDAKRDMIHGAMMFLFNTHPNPKKGFNRPPHEAIALRVLNVLQQRDALIVDVIEQEAYAVGLDKKPVKHLVGFAEQMLQGKTLRTTSSIIVSRTDATIMVERWKMLG